MAASITCIIPVLCLNFVHRMCDYCRYDSDAKQILGTWGMKMKRAAAAALALALAFFIANCGGGGSSNSTGSSNIGGVPGTGAGGSGSGPTAVSLKTVSFSSQDVLAKTRFDPSLAQSHLETGPFNRFLNKLSDFIIPPLAAQSGTPIKISNSQDITKKLVSGSLVRINVTYEPDASGSNTSCDLSTAEILVNKIWLANRENNDFIANLSVMSSVNASCEASYTSSDYFIDGKNNRAYKLDGNVLGAVNDVIPARDPAFNTSANALLLLSGGQVSELAFESETPRVTQLTTDSLGVNSDYWTLAYNGKHLVGIARRSDNPIIIFEKGKTSFSLIRVEGNGYPSIFINPDGQFVWSQGTGNMNIVDPNGSISGQYLPSPIPENMFSPRGRYETWLLGDRCMLWNTSNGEWVNLYFYPQNASRVTGGARLDFVRLAGKYAYCIDQNFDGYARYDLESGSGVGVDLALFGFVASGYEIFEDFAFAKVTNTSNSDVEFIEIDFSTGEVRRLGVIKQGSRKVIDLQPTG